MASNSKQRPSIIQELKGFYTQLKIFRDLYVERMKAKIVLGSKERKREGIREELVRKSGGLKQIVVHLTGKQYGQQFNESFDIWTEALGASLDSPLQRWCLGALMDNVNEAIGRLEAEPKLEKLFEITPPNEADKQELIKELEQFLNQFVRYKEFVLIQKEKRIALDLEDEFQMLRLELQRKYGRLKEVLEKYGGSTEVLLQGGKHKYEAFTSAFSYTGFGPVALEVVMDTAIAAINTTIGSLENVLQVEQVPLEAIYPSGTPYSAYKDIKDIIILAANKLTIVDMWVDSSVVSLLENVHLGVEVQVLTRHMQGDFKLAVQKFKEQREMAKQGSLEVRQDKGNFHDRFIVADDNFFHLGASIKDAGTKVFAINAIEDPRNKSVLMESILKAWDAAEEVL